MLTVLLFAAAVMIKYLATDMDKTLVFYDASVAVGHTPATVALPASSGTGRVGRVALETMELLSNITQRGTRVICVSGQRATTMLQRAPYFPSIKYWVCEGGSRLFVRDDEGGSFQLVEDPNFAKRIYSASGISASSQQYHADVEMLRGFGSDLEKRGFNVDTKGLQLMLRVKVDDAALEGILATLPARLRHTFNLGYLDITLAPIDKQTAIAQVIADNGGGSYVFIGDDDNDLTAAQHSVEAFVARPCSSGMRSWLASLGVPAALLGDEVDGELLSQTHRFDTGLSSPRAVTVPSRKNHEGCIALLRRIIETQID